MGTSLRAWPKKVWQMVSGNLLATSAVAGVLLYRLGTLVPQLSAREVASFTTSTVAGVEANPFYAPYKFLQNISVKIFGESAFALRLSSVIVGLVTVVLFHYILSNWFSRRVAAIGTILFATSAWFLHVARLGEPLIMQLGLVSLVAYGAWLRARVRNHWALVLGAALTAILLYVPGFIWLIFVAALWQRKTLRRLMTISWIHSVLAILVFCVLLAPLAYALLQSPALTRGLFGLPDTWGAVGEIPRNLLRVPYHLIIHGPMEPDRWLGNLPLIDFFSLILALLGAYSFGLDWRLDRTRFITLGLVSCWLLVGLQGQVAIVTLLPFVYLLVASGIAFMLKQWFGVFPFNPFARGLAIGLIVAGLAAVTWYNVQHYYVAWPQAPATQDVFNRNL